MSAPWYPVCWIDPGGTTGVSAWEPMNGLWQNEGDFMTAGNMIEAICAGHGGLLRIGWEKFNIHSKTPAAGAHLAIEMIGVTRRCAMKYGAMILPLANQNDRNTASPEMLKAMGWWLPGAKDAQSSTQHLVAYMLRAGCVPDREEAIIRDLIHQGEDEHDHQARKRV